MYVPNGAALVGDPERNASYAPSLPMDQGQQFAETIGYESSRTEDTCRIGIGPRSISIILLCVLLRISGRHRVSLGNFDDDELSARVYIRLPITRPLPQIEDLLPSNGNCIEYETIIQTSETTTKHRGGPVWILFHDDYYTNFEHINMHYGTRPVYERQKSFYLYEYNVAPPRMRATVMDLQGCVGN